MKIKKTLTLILIVVLASIIGAIYGIIHDQLTYTISSEYYTKFKFKQFGLTDTNLPIRMIVSIVGVMATWWVGLIIGLILALVGLRQKTSKQMFSVTLRAFIFTILIALITGLVGLLYGKIFLTNKTLTHWNLPVDLTNPDQFIMVGSMHNFSYLGGLIGLVIGIIYSVKQKKKLHLQLD